MKAIITDLDRTLLRTDKSISEYTLTVLQECKARGIFLLAASARPMRTIEEYKNMVGFDAVTAMNGAAVYLPGKEFKCGIPKDSGEEILGQFCKDEKVFLSIETDRGIYSNREIPEWSPILYDGFPALPEGCTLYKILASSENPSFYEGIEQKLTADTYYSIAHSGVINRLVQVMSKNATKWNGIKEMLSFFGIDPREAVYFGDDNDDIQPIKNCGIGVAMANSIPAVLEAADQVTLSNDEDGVAVYIREKILL